MKITNYRDLVEFIVVCQHNTRVLMSLKASPYNYLNLLIIITIYIAHKLNIETAAENIIHFES